MKYSLSLDEIGDIFMRLVNQYRMMDEKIPYYSKSADMLLHISEVHTIDAIGRNENINVTNLAKFRGVTKGAISQMIKKLAGKGLVIKSVSSETENEVVLRLTESGKEVFDEHKKYHESLNGKIAELLSRVPKEAVDNFANLSLDLEELFKEISRKRMEALKERTKD